MVLRVRGMKDICKRKKPSVSSFIYDKMIKILTVVNYERLDFFVIHDRRRCESFLDYEAERR